MTETPNAEPESSSSTGRTVAIVAVLGLVLGVAVVVFALDGDDDETADTTVPAETTVAPSTTAPGTTVPGTTAPPTTGPATTAAPATTAPPDTTAPPTTAPTTTAPTTTAPPANELEFTIADIDDGGTIPTEFTCDGDNTAPILTVESVPDGTVQLALLVDDPDAPTPEPFVHWVVYGIPGDAGEITDGNDAFTYGANDIPTEEWFGPCPPEGDGPHGYEFTLFALDSDLGLEPGLDGRALEEAVEGATIAAFTVTADYERAG